MFVDTRDCHDVWITGTVCGLRTPRIENPVEGNLDDEDVCPARLKTTRYLRGSDVPTMSNDVQIPGTVCGTRTERIESLVEGNLADGPVCPARLENTIHLEEVMFR